MTGTAGGRHARSRCATIIGRVVDADGNPVSGATIERIPSRAAISPCTCLVATGIDGRFPCRTCRPVASMLLIGGGDRAACEPRRQKGAFARRMAVRPARRPTSARCGSGIDDQRMLSAGADSDELIAMVSLSSEPSAPWNLAGPGRSAAGPGSPRPGTSWSATCDDGPEAAVDRVLAGTCRIEGVPPSSPRRRTCSATRPPASDADRLQAWWLYRMLFTPDPLSERLTLMWHDHFATSQLKVDDVGRDAAQNETFRAPRPRPVRRPAARDAPRPGLARLARRTVEPQGEAEREPRPRAAGAVHARRGPLHRGRRQGGRTGTDGPDGRARPVSQYGRRTTTTARRPSSARPRGSTPTRSPTTCSSAGRGRPAGLAALHDVPGRRRRRRHGAGASWPTELRRDGLHVGRAVETVLRSELFFSARNLHARVFRPGRVRRRDVAGPGAVRPAAQHLLLAEWTARLGQELFYPPNVGGWPGGRGWLSGRAVVARANFAAALSAAA